MAVAQADNWLEGELTRQYALVHDAALADTFKLATNDEFEQAFADLIAFARTRPAFVRTRARTAAVRAFAGRV